MQTFLIVLIIKTPNKSEQRSASHFHNNFGLICKSLSLRSIRLRNLNYFCESTYVFRHLFVFYNLYVLIIANNLLKSITFLFFSNTLHSLCNMQLAMQQCNNCIIHSILSSFPFFLCFLCFIRCIMLHYILFSSLSFFSKDMTINIMNMTHNYPFRF